MPSESPTDRELLEEILRRVRRIEQQLVKGAPQVPSLPEGIPSSTVRRTDHAEAPENFESQGVIDSAIKTPTPKKAQRKT
jgi:hypothetical protein